MQLWLVFNAFFINLQANWVSWAKINWSPSFSILKTLMFSVIREPGNHTIFLNFSLPKKKKKIYSRTKLIGVRVIWKNPSFMWIWGTGGWKINILKSILTSMSWNQTCNIKFPPVGRLFRGSFFSLKDF